MAAKDTSLCGESDIESNSAGELSTDEASPKNNNVKHFKISTPKFDQPSPGSWSQLSPGSWSQPSPGSYCQPSPGSYCQPSPGSYSQPSPGSYSQPSPGSCSQLRLSSYSRDSLLHALLTGDLSDVKHMISPAKLEQLTRARQEADKSYVELKMKELAAGAIPKAAGRCHEQLEKKVQSIAANSFSERPKIKSRTGKLFTPLATSKGVLPKTDDTNLSKLEKVEFAQKLKEIMKESLGDLKKESEKAKGKVGKNIPTTKIDKSLVRNTEEKNKLETEIQNITENVETLITEEQTMLGESGELRISNKHDLAKLIRLNYENLQDKTRLLNCKSSTLKVKCDLMMFENKSKTLAMNKLGDALKESIKKLKHETKEINEKLKMYKRKEQSSESFRKTVQEYVKCKANLEHLKVTLEMLKN